MLCIVIADPPCFAGTFRRKKKNEKEETKKKKTKNNNRSLTTTTATNNNNKTKAIVGCTMSKKKLKLRDGPTHPVCRAATLTKDVAHQICYIQPVKVY